MAFHRHVTATRPDGTSYYAVSEEMTPIQVKFQPGMQFFKVWGTPDVGPEIGPATDPTFTPFFPGPHATRVQIVRFPPYDPATPAFDIGGPAEREALRADAEAQLPGLFEAHEADEGDPGFHATETIDYVFVIEGELHLHQDGGDVVRLSVGDCIVQRGTNHKWSNRAPAPAAMAVVLIGAEHRDDPS